MQVERYIASSAYEYPLTIKSGPDGFKFARKIDPSYTQPITTPSGGPMNRSTQRDIDSRINQLEEAAAATARELAFLTSLPEEPEVNIREVEPSVVLINRLHLKTGEVLQSTVLRSNGGRRGDAIWRTDARAYDGYDWETSLRQAYSSDSDLVVRELNPGKLLYTTVKGDDAAQDAAQS